MEIPPGFRHRLPRHAIVATGGAYRHCRSCGCSVSLHCLTQQPWECSFCDDCPGLDTDELVALIDTYLARPGPYLRPWIPLAVQRAVLERDGFRCRYCRRRVHRRKSGPQKLHFDHVIPYIKGGPTTVENIVVSCRTCNISKSAHDAEEWLARRRVRPRLAAAL